MSWSEVSITVDPQACEAICGLLQETGVKGVSIEDETLLADHSRSTALWDVLDDDLRKKYEGKAVIKAYYPPDTQMDAILGEIWEGIARAREYVETGEPFIEVTKVKEEDWENNWKQYYKPVLVGKNMVIMPLWEEETAQRDIVIALDPGMAFGTGTHETTFMCLELLEDCVTPDCTVLDIGTGSGILSIGCAKLGASAVTAVDIDPVAVKVAKQNIEHNALGERIRVIAGNLTDCVSGRYDIVVANIIADAIAGLAGTVGGFLKENGVLIASGIIHNKMEIVEKAFAEHHIKIVHQRQMGDWIALVCRSNS